VGTGSVTGFVALPSECFTQEVYSTIYLELEGLDRYNCYMDEAYEAHVDDFIESLKPLAGERARIREKQVAEDGSILLTVDHKSTEGLTYSWYLDGELQDTKDASITIPSDYAGYIAVRVHDENGNYRSELCDSLADVKDFEIETETTEAPTTEAPTEAPTEEPTEIATEAPTEIVTEEKTEVTTEVKTEAKTEEQTEPKTSKSCGSSLSGAAGIITACAAGAAIVLKKKKED
jgi:hypothetical protein